MITISQRFLDDNAERIERLCRIWNLQTYELLEWILKEGLEQLETHTRVIMQHQEVSS